MTEVGAMNLLFYWVNEEGEEELVTAPLHRGDILPGTVRVLLLVWLVACLSFFCGAGSGGGVSCVVVLWGLSCCGVCVENRSFLCFLVGDAKKRTTGRRPSHHLVFFSLPPLSACLSVHPQASRAAASWSSPAPGGSSRCDFPPAFFPCC